MKKLKQEWIYSILILFFSFFVSYEVSASNYSHTIDLSPGWNLISTPRIVDSHQFSAPETVENFLIYLKSSTSASGWETLSEAGQTEFTPLFGYFINNKTGVNQTLTLNYKQNNNPSERMFSRDLLSGWNVLGVANPSYALKQKDANSLDTNNIQNILNSIESSVSSVLDLTASSTKSSVAVSDAWDQRVFSEANQLDDFRETKAYAIFLNSSAEYNGFQNDDEIIIDSEPEATSTPIIITSKATSPSDFSASRGTGNVVALLANINTEEAIHSQGLVINIEKTASSSFENIKVFLNNYLVDSFSATTTGSVLIDSNVELMAGDNEIKITVDIKTDAVDNEEFKVSIDNNVLISPEYHSSANPVTPEFIEGEANGAIITIKLPVFTVTRSDGYQEFMGLAPGSTDVSLGKFAVTSQNDTLRIDSVSFGPNIGTASSTSIYDMKLYVDGFQVDSTRNFDSSGVVFSILNLYIPNGATKQIELKGSFDSSAVGTFQTEVSFIVRDSINKIVESSTAKTTSFNLENGTINISMYSSQDRLLITEPNEQKIASFVFRAVNGDATLKRINIINTLPNTSYIASTTSGISDSDGIVNSLRFYRDGNFLGLCPLIEGSCNLDINLSIGKDESKVIDINAVLNNIESSAETNKNIHLGITTVDFSLPSGELIVKEVALLASNYFVRKTRPTFISEMLPDNILLSGNRPVSKFGIVADSNADVKIAKLAVKLNSSNGVTISTTTDAVIVNGESRGISSSIVDDYIIIDFGTTTPEIITAGSYKIFEIRANIDVSSEPGQFLGTYIETSADYKTVSSTDYSSVKDIIWSDSSSVDGSDDLWFNSWGIGNHATSQVLTN